MLNVKVSSTFSIKYAPYRTVMMWMAQILHKLRTIIKKPSATFDDLFFVLTLPREEEPPSAAAAAAAEEEEEEEEEEKEALVEHTFRRNSTATTERL